MLHVPLLAILALYPSDYFLLVCNSSFFLKSSFIGLVEFCKPVTINVLSTEKDENQRKINLKS